ncbi:MAG TPA: hypothetical protein VFU43_02375 [Streptosporangiaceae bacterium]|nr:hypothetical protein [Streptosporangiaceae bacterium]
MPSSRAVLAAARRWVVPVAAPAVIALAIAAGVDFINRHAPTSDEAGREPGRAGAAQPVGPAWDRPAPTLMAKGRPLPRHLVSVSRSGSAVVVRDVRTLAAVARVEAPAKRRFRQVAAAGLDPSSYIVSASAGGGTAFYRLRIGGDGRPDPLRPLSRIWLPGASTAWSDMAVNERGDTMAYVSYRSSRASGSSRSAGANGGSNGGASRPRITIDVVPTTGGTRRTWTTSLNGRIGGLSWAGRTLSFVWAPMRGTKVLRHQVRTVDTALPPGDLKVSRPGLTLPDRADTAVMSRDGSTVVTGIAARSGLELAAYSTADGRRTGVLWRGPGGRRPPRVVQLVADAGSGDLIAVAADGRVLVAPAHGGTAFAAADIADVAW